MGFVTLRTGVRPTFANTKKWVKYLLSQVFTYKLPDFDS